MNRQLRDERIRIPLPLLFFSKILVFSGLGGVIRAKFLILWKAVAKLPQWKSFEISGSGLWLFSAGANGKGGLRRPEVCFAL